MRELSQLMSEHVMFTGAKATLIKYIIEYIRTKKNDAESFRKILALLNKIDQEYFLIQILGVVEMVDIMPKLG